MPENSTERREASLNKKVVDGLEALLSTYASKRKKLRQGEAVCRLLIAAGFEFELPYDLEHAFIRIEREQLPALRKALGLTLKVSCKVAENENTIKVFIRTEVYSDVYFWYLKSYHGKGHCKIVEQEEVTPAKESKYYAIVCET